MHQHNIEYSNMTVLYILYTPISFAPAIVFQIAMCMFLGLCFVCAAEAAAACVMYIGFFS